MYSSAGINAAAVAVAAARHPVRNPYFFPFFIRIILSDARARAERVAIFFFCSKSRRFSKTTSLESRDSFLRIHYRHVLVASIARVSALPLNGSGFQPSIDLSFTKISRHSWLLNNKRFDIKRFLKFKLQRSK